MILFLQTVQKYVVNLLDDINDFEKKRAATGLPLRCVTLKFTSMKKFIIIKLNQLGK